VTLTGRNSKTVHYFYGHGNDVKNTATRELDLDYEQRKLLFFIERWGNAFYERYQDSVDDQKRAEVTVEYIDHFIAKHSGAGDK
jgi:4-hydroxyphenylpyruvate dioxygenase-like putative hemolysin